LTDALGHCSLQVGGKLTARVKTKPFFRRSCCKRDQRLNYELLFADIENNHKLETFAKSSAKEFPISRFMKLSRTIVLCFRLFPELYTFDNNVRNESENKKQKQHPGNTLKRADHCPVKFEYPTLSRELQDGTTLSLRSNISLQVPYSYPSGYPDNIDSEQDILAPGYIDFFSNEPLQDPIHWCPENLCDHEANTEGNNEIYDKQCYEHLNLPELVTGFHNMSLSTANSAHPGS
jgi:hypothetical protein